MAWQELGLYLIEVDQIWRDREQITNVVKKVHRNSITVKWKHVRSVSQCAIDDRHWEQFNGKPKTTIEVKGQGTITILADYKSFRDKWAEFLDTYLEVSYNKRDN